MIQLLCLILSKNVVFTRKFDNQGGNNMSRLIIVAGAGGAGKSFFLRLWAEHDQNAQRIKKFASSHRAPREIEIKSGDSDLIFDARYNPATPEGKAWYDEKYPELPYPSKLKFHNKQYDFSSCDNNSNIYIYHNTYYEVDTESIDDALKMGKNPIVIVRKCETIKNLLKIYNNALIIYVQSILSGDDLVKKLVALGESAEDAKKREGRNAEDLNDYISSIQQLPSNIRVVINDFNEDHSGAVFTQIRDIYNEEIRNYKFKAQSIFVIQSYLNPVRSNDFFKSIQYAALETFGTLNNVYQANLRQDGSYSIPEHVWSAIDSSDCIICDVTNDRCCDCDKISTNPSGEVLRKNLQGVSSNVWLELGYSLSILKKRGISPEKRLIIVSEDTSSGRTVIPVDLGGTALNVVTYNGSMDLISKVRTQLKNMYNH